MFKRPEPIGCFILMWISSPYGCVVLNAQSGHWLNGPGLRSQWYACWRWLSTLLNLLPHPSPHCRWRYSSLSLGWQLCLSKWFTERWILGHFLHLKTKPVLHVEHLALSERSNGNLHIAQYGVQSSETKKVCFEEQTSNLRTTVTSLSIHRFWWLALAPLALERPEAAAWRSCWARWSRSWVHLKED